MAVRIHHRLRRSCHDGEPMGPEPSPERSPWTTTATSTAPARPRPGERLEEHQRRIYVPLLLSALLPIVVAASRSDDGLAGVDRRQRPRVARVRLRPLRPRPAGAALPAQQGRRVRPRHRHHHRAVVPAPGLRGLPDPGAGPPGPADPPLLRQQGRPPARPAAGLGGPVRPSPCCSSARGWPTSPSTRPTPSSPRSATRSGGGSSPSPPWAMATSSPSPRRGGSPASFLMLTGVATLGVISGTLASAFRSTSRSAGRGGRRRPGRRAAGATTDGGDHRRPAGTAGRPAGPPRGARAARRDARRAQQPVAAGLAPPAAAVGPSLPHLRWRT